MTYLCASMTKESTFDSCTKRETFRSLHRPVQTDSESHEVVFYSQLRLHVVVLHKSLAGELQVRRALSGGTEKAPGVTWTGKDFIGQKK